MGNHYEQEKPVEPELDDEGEDSSASETLDMHSNMEADDDFIDDWISHVDDYDNSDDINNW